MLVRLLQALPTDAGFSITRMITPPGAPEFINGTTARVVLSGGGMGVADDSNPATALQRAWGFAHLEKAERLLAPTRTASP